MHIFSLHFVAATVLACLPSLAGAQEVIRGAGGPINYDLGYGIMSNEGSSLSREWYVVNDPDLPVAIDPAGYEGLQTNLTQSSYQYRVKFTLKVSQPVSAVEIVIIPFDVWNNSNRPLGLSEITDMAAPTATVDGVWTVFSENEALGMLTSFAYIDRVRLKDGTVILADREAILDEARKISSGLSEADIVPPPPKAD